MDADCVFCKIVNGDLPATRVFEDDRVLAFLDIGPIAKGHTLVIPKIHVDPITSAGDAVLHAVISAVRRVARAQMDGLQAHGVNVTQANGRVAGQVVPHMHFHVIPRFSGDSRARNWHPGTYENREEMERFAARLRAALLPEHESGLASQMPNAGVN